MGEVAQNAALCAAFAEQHSRLVEDGLPDRDARVQVVDLECFSNKEDLSNDSRTQILRSRLFWH